MEAPKNVFFLMSSGSKIGEGKRWPCFHNIQNEKMIAKERNIIINGGS